MAVVRNPFAGIDQQDLSDLFDIGARLGHLLAEELVKMLNGQAICYGKAALVGSLGAMEHGAAVLHPALGKPVRAAVGGGKALMPSNHKVGALGSSIDLPLGHKDEAWSFDHIDTMTVWVPDAPRADEIVLCIGLSDGTRAYGTVHITDRAVMNLLAQYMRSSICDGGNYIDVERGISLGCPSVRGSPLFTSTNSTDLREDRVAFWCHWGRRGQIAADS